MIYFNNLGDCTGPLPSKIQKAQLETLVEEPEPCDIEIARLCLPSVARAAVKGDVLQWCSCKFNKSRCLFFLLH